MGLYIALAVIFILFLAAAFVAAMLAERIDKEYSKLKEQIEKQKCL